jgi:uncharacterized protein with HEPN domain
MDLVALTQGPQDEHAAERRLERISEAARKLGGVAEELCPGVPRPQLRALGNLLRHEYDSIDIARVWLMIEDDLAPHKAGAQAALNHLLEKDEGR